MLDAGAESSSGRRKEEPLNKIDTIGSWTDAFLIYLAIFVERFPFEVSQNAVASPHRSEIDPNMVTERRPCSYCRVSMQILSIPCPTRRLCVDLPDEQRNVRSCDCCGLYRRARGFEKHLRADNSRTSTYTCRVRRRACRRAMWYARRFA